MKAPILSVVLLTLLTCVSFGVWMDDEVTPENINEKYFKFTLEITGGKGKADATIKLTIEPKEGRDMPDGTSVSLDVYDKKAGLKATIPIDIIRTAKKNEVRTIYLSPKIVACSTLNFDISSGVVSSGGGHVFKLSKFVKP